MNTATFLWHDYETTGTDPRRDRPAQFAGLRTTLELEPIGDPIVAWCKPARDTLPQPEAALVTGITPQHCEREGMIEAQFAAVVHDALAEPGTCGAGYNSIRFDDEATRHLLYRNFYEPYAREWENDNSRWDLIDLVRMCFALRPEGIVWPEREPGVASFKLGDLSTANALAHDRAHDALSDVHATIALARLLRERQPRLFDWHFAMRRKRKAFELLDWLKRTPVLHVSSRYPATRGCLAMVAPLALVPGQTNAVIVYDLDCDPQDLLDLDVDEIRDRLFTPRADLPEGVERIPLKAVHANRSPALAPLKTLSGVDLTRIGLDTARCERHLARLNTADGLAEKVRQVFARATDDRVEDPDIALYSGGFIPDADRKALGEVRTSTPERLATKPPKFRDARFTELLFRYRARNWESSLNAGEMQRWRQHCRSRLETANAAVTLNFETYGALLTQLRTDPARSGEQHAVLDALEAWGQRLNEETAT